MAFIEINKKNLTKVANRYGVVDPFEIILLFPELNNPNLEYVIVQEKVLQRRAKEITQKRIDTYKSVLAALTQEITPEG